MPKILSYSDGGKKVKVRSKQKSGSSKLSTSQRIRISRALRKWARNNRGKIRQRKKYWKGKRLSQAVRSKISRSLKRLKR